MGRLLDFKMAARLATKLDKNQLPFANRWNRRVSIVARIEMMNQGHCALRKHPRYSLHNRDDVMDNDDDDGDTHMHV